MDHIYSVPITRHQSVDVGVSRICMEDALVIEEMRTR